MKLLVLMSAWAPDESESSTKWIGFYNSLLSSDFAAEDKVIAINCGAPAFVADTLANLPRVVGIGSTPAELRIDSDASGFQTCLTLAAPVIGNYDAVLFLHTKGVSYDYEQTSSLRAGLSKTILSRDALLRAFSAPGRFLVADRGHLPQTLTSCFEVLRSAQMFGAPPAHFTLAASFTLFAVSASVLHELIGHPAADAALRQNLSLIGFNRFFFEGPFPSLLSHGCDDVIFLGGRELNPLLNDNVCADAFPRHNSYLTHREFHRYKARPSQYSQKPLPYIFGPADALNLLRVQFTP